MGGRPPASKLLYVALLICSIYQVAGWAEVGHMMVAKIAQIDMIQHGYRAAYDEAKKQALLGRELTPNLTEYFEACSVWADDTKYEQNVHLYDELHYTSQVYNVDGMNANYLPPYEDVLMAIETAIKGLKSPKTKGLLTMEKAMLMRFLIHFVGDMHQPLHTTDLLNESFPTGDAGANLFKVTLNIPIRNDTWKIDNLHAYWDFAGGKWPILERPISAKSISYVTSLTEQAMKAHPRSSFQKELQEKDVTKWARSFFHIAREVVYRLMIEKNGVIDEEYDKLTYPVMIRQVALAGYRLADILKDIYAPQQFARESEVKTEKSILERFISLRKVIAREL